MVQVHELHVLARKILVSLAEALSLPPATFDSLLEINMPCSTSHLPSASNLEAILYFNDGRKGQNSATESCEAHVDKGLLTLIHADSEQGLQVLLYVQCVPCMHVYKHVHLDIQHGTHVFKV